MEALKKCCKCNWVKPESAFYNNSNRCKECARKYQREYAKTHHEEVLAYARAYKHTPKGLEINRRGVSKWKKANPEKRKAHRLVQSAIEKGLLLKQPCNVCGKEIVEGHHEDYTKPLDVIWLCRTHHRELHRKGL